jgi:predicted nucleic acid-binding protein
MAVIFLDTSALVRRYDRAEAGASRVRAACAPSQGNTLLVARLASVETASAFARKVRQGAFSAADQRRLWRLFRAHWRDQYQVVALTDHVHSRAEQLLFRYPLRAYDALHLGCALTVVAQLSSSAPEFWTGDRQQAQAAGREGLAVQLVT